MRLLTSLTSPYGRKARMAASILGLAGDLVIEPADTRDPHDPLHHHNPLGKMPVLITDDEVPVYDSWVIMEYLDWAAGGGIIVPADPVRRFPELTRAKLADGILDASLLVVYEDRYREESQRSEVWLERQRHKIRRALDTISERLPDIQPPLVSGITLACALSYLDWRKPLAWRDSHPTLVEWLDGFAARVPAYAETARPNDV